MKGQQFLDMMEQVDDDLLERSERNTAKLKRRAWLKWSSIAACAAVAVLTVVLLAGQAWRIPLGDRSAGVTARYAVGNIKVSPSENMLIYLTEEELFTHWETAVFEGTIKKIDNIVLSFNGDTMHKALAEIKVERIYRGELTVGETAVILLPCSVGNGVWVEDTDTTIAMKVGTRGIFMPIIYDNDSFIESHGATLYLKELANYGFADGSRYAFLDTDSGLVFDEHAYPSLKGATSFDEIREFVAEMVEKTSKK